jgi:LacI family transcriptional regulator
MTRKPTINDVAEKAGVSISSVSRVINNYPGVHSSMRTRVEEALEMLDYCLPSEKKRISEYSNRLIYFILTNRDLRIPFHSKVLQSIENECSRKGDVVLFRTFRYAPESQPSDLNLQKHLELTLLGNKKALPDGVVLTGPTYPNLIESLNNIKVPFVLLGNNFTGGDHPGGAVSFDGYQGAYDATRYLIDLGHSHILFIGDPSISWFSGLYEGYMRAIEENHLTPIAQIKSLSDSFYSNGYLSVEMMFERSSEISAVFAGYDETALGAWKAVNDRKLSVPRDVSLIGFDDEDYAAFTVPPLTTVRIDVDAIGRELISQLYEKLNNPSIELPVIKLETSLVKRGTCRPVSA